MVEPHERRLNHHEAGRQILRWLALSKQPRNVNELLDALEETVIITPFNHVQGQWFLGTEKLPNQDELDRLRQDLEFLEGVSEERHHKIMDLIDDRNRLSAQVEQLQQSQALLDEVFEALDGEEPEQALKLLRRRYDKQLGAREA